MEKKTMLALAAMAAAINAFAAAFDFKPADTADSFNWNTPSLWYVGSTVQNRLPTSADDTWITSKYLRNVPFYIDSATSAATRKLFLANSASSTYPMILTIDGGSLTTYGDAWIGQKSPGNLIIQNGGAFVAKSVLYIGLKNTSTDAGSQHVFDAKVFVADSASSLTAATHIYMGDQIGGTSLLDNKGTVSITGSGQLRLGVCVTEGINRGDIVSVVTNSGTISVANAMRVGFRTNTVGRVVNTGDITVGGEFNLGHNLYSYGSLRHAAGTLSLAGSVYVGLSGDGYLELAGDTETAFPDRVFAIAQNNWKNDGSVRSRGEFVITNSASLSRCGMSLTAGVHKYATARIALYDDAKLSDISTFTFGNVKTDNSFEVYDNTVVSNVDLFVLNVGSTANDVEGKTTMKLSDNAKVCDLTNAYIGSNTYNRVELEIADNAWFGLRDDAWTTNLINVARDSYKSGDATIRMRGGMIGLGIRGGLVLGSTEDNANVQCTSRLIGYGCVTNQGDRSRTVWSRLDIRAGSATADGEGMERDLDLSTFARVSGSSGDGRDHLNVSGTNGWYAINKGRLLYPNMDGELIRFVGEYSRLTDAFKPKLVNAMKIILKDANDTEVTDHRRFNIAMYAPDRTDIPAGLVEDDATNRRLGIWKGDVTGNANGKFATAEATIRYDQWRLGELKDVYGNYPPNLVIHLYKHDGSANGKWTKVSSYSVADAETNEYRIGGDISNEVSGKHDIGWFAVVAKSEKGTCITLR